VLRSSIRGFQLRCAAHADLVLWEAARVVEAEGRVEELDPLVSAPSRSGRRCGSNGKQPV
jgi:hypothetical protein